MSACGARGGLLRRAAVAWSASQAPAGAPTPATRPCRRSLTGRRKHRVWEPQLLDPPAALADVSVVLVSPKRPNSVGAVARAASSFECEDVRIVAPRCNHLARSARNGSKGAQYLLWRAQLCDSLAEAAAGAAVTVAFTRWVQGACAGRGGGLALHALALWQGRARHAQHRRDLPPGAACAGRPRAFRSPAELFAADALQHLLLRPGSSGGQAAAGAGSAAGDAAAGKVLFVFGREESGLTDEEIASCDYVCSIPIGRLQESLSLSHAVSVVLSQLFQLRLAGGSSVVPGSLAELAEGFPLDESEDE